MKALVITLPERPERTEAAKQRLAGLDIHFVLGLDGIGTGLQVTHTYELDNPGTGYTIGPVTMGIFLSHYIAWAVRDSIPDEYVLILEDDAVIRDNFSAELEDVLRRVPKDFDVLFLGSCCTEGAPRTQIDGNIYDLRYPQCLHAYVLSKNAAQVLLRNCRDVNGPVDCVLAANKFYGLKVLTVVPRIVDQHATEMPN